MAYYSGQGRVYIGARDAAGNPQGLSYVGNVPELKVSLSVETLEHQESTSGQRLTDLQLIKTKKGEFACTLEELVPVNLELALQKLMGDEAGAPAAGASPKAQMKGLDAEQERLLELMKREEERDWERKQEREEEEPVNDW